MAEKPSPDHAEPNYDQYADQMDQAWTDMTSERIRNPETRVEAEAELRRAKSESAESRADSVTGLANHRGFVERLDVAYQYAVRHKKEGVNLHVDVIDVKGLSVWNRSPDQSSGDRVLQVLSDALLTVSQRATDYPARVGGDEFAIVRENGSPDDTFVDRLYEELAKPERHIDGKPIEIYVGSASWNGQETGEDVYKTAQGRMSMEKGQFSLHRPLHRK